MDKVYVLTAASGSWDDYCISIIDIYKNEQDAIDRMNIIEEEMKTFKAKYSSEEYEKLEDELYDFVDENPAFSGPYPKLPAHLKEFTEYRIKKFNGTIYHTFEVKEHILK